MRTQLKTLLFVGCISLFLLSGCTASDRSGSDTDQNADRSTETSSGDATGWTSVEAAEEAYAMIKKDWNTNAVFWYMSPTRLDPGWETSDRAEWWTVKFVTPDNTGTRLVYLGGPLDGTIDDVGNTRKKPILPTYPIIKPKYSMAEAFETVIDNDGPTGVMPEMVYYDTDSLSYPNQPVWSFVFKFTVTAGEEYHYFFVDGQTNELIIAAYKQNGDLIDKSKVQAKY